MTDNLRYAENALQGGAGFVNTAMMKAANAVNGMLNRYMEQHADDDNWFTLLERIGRRLTRHFHQRHLGRVEEHDKRNGKRGH